MIVNSNGIVTSLESTDSIPSAFYADGNAFSINALVLNNTFSNVTTINSSLNAHISNTSIHVTVAEKSTWNAKANTTSPSFTDVPTAPTAPTGTNTTQIATTAYVVSGLSGKQDTLSFDSTPTLNSINPVTSNGVFNALTLKANLASPTFTGIPNAPTATSGTSTNQLATTEFVTSGLSGKQDTLTFDSTPTSGSTNPITSGGVYSSLSLKSNLASPTFTGIPNAPTAVDGTSTAQLATTAFVQNAVISRYYSTSGNNNSIIYGASDPNDASISGVEGDIYIMIS